MANLGASDKARQWQRSLAAAAAGCADHGELAALAHRLEAVDADGWHDVWSALAEQRCNEAQSRERRGAPAATAYLHGCEYWRQAFHFLRHAPGDARTQLAWQAHRNAFRCALAGLPLAVRQAELPIARSHMPLYLLRPRRDSRPRPTLLLAGPPASTAESGYAGLGHTALRQGYNVVLWDGPGQGSMLYQQGLPLRPDYENVLKLIISWVLQQEGVASGSLVLLGQGFGSLQAARAASFDGRLAALVLTPGLVDGVSGLWPRELGPSVWQRVLAADPEIDARLQTLLDEPGQGWRLRLASHGVSSVGACLRLLPAYGIGRLAGQIRCPTLITLAPGGNAVQGRRLRSLLHCPRHLLRYSIAPRCMAAGQCRILAWLKRLLPMPGAIN